MKINVTKEGRPNIYLPEKQSLVDWVKEKKFKVIHNFIPTGSMVLGADHSASSVIEDIENSERIALFTDNSNMGHALAIIKDEKLECYNIGKISADDLEVKEN